MSDASTKHEIEARPLGNGWVEVRMVYEATGQGDQQQPHHSRGLRARSDIARFILTFAASIARDAGLPNVGRALHLLINHIHGCTCGHDIKH